jgi:23S rRNA (uracil1939-C5)-methyltransferase
VEKGDYVSLLVERIAFGGAGIARHQGMTVFIDFTVPGDLAGVKIGEVHKNWARGDLVKIEAPSPRRTDPVCPYYGRCGGCSLQHLAYETQVTEKKAMLADALTRIGGFSSLPAPGVFPSPPLEYRNRVRFHLAKSPKARAKPAFMGRRSGETVPIRECPVADPGIQAFLREGLLPEAFRSGGKKGAPRFPGSFTVYSRGDLLLCEGEKLSRGKIRILEQELTIDAGVFFQSNAQMLEVLIVELLKAADLADRDLPAADIYCGVGTFAAFLRDHFKIIDLIEENKTALALARENVTGASHRFFALKDDEWIKTLGKTEGAYGFAVADPPRQGLSAAMGQWLAGNGPGVLAYVSCDPPTLARDAAVLGKGGYELRSLDFFDFYPQTGHIESLAVFIRQEHA